MDNRPLIAIPIGDPAGIGPEIVVKAAADPEISALARCVAIGDARVLEQAIACSGVSLKIHCVQQPSRGSYQEGILDVIDLQQVQMDRLVPGQISAMCGKAAYEYIKMSIELAMEKKVDAVATAPINKEALHQAGVPYIGHTEIFGALTGTKDPLTMFEVRDMRVFFLSRHVSLRQACDMVTQERIVDCAKRCIAMLKKMGVDQGCMAVAGLNPHSGEHGMFGTEEEEAIVPAVRELQRQGYAVAGPIGADSVFHLALQGKFNSVLSLYHDQGHIATKTLDFERTISVTGGMPILRTSVDHGTAMDIAAKGIASPVSMKEAIRVATKYAPFYRGEN